MARSSRGTPLGWSIVFFAICSVWLVLMLSNRSMALPLFFLGGQTLALPVGFWLFGVFVLGNGISLGILSFLQFTIVRLAQNQGRGVPPRNADSQREWDEDEEEQDEEDEFDWEEPAIPQKSAQKPDPPVSPAPVSAQPAQPQTDRSPESTEKNVDLEASVEPPVSSDPSTPAPASTPSHEGKVYEAPPSPRQGSQEGSSYSYQYRPARRAQQPVDRPPTDRPPVSQSSRPSPSQKPQAGGGLRQKVVDVNYRVINPGSGASPAGTSPRFPEGKKQTDRGRDSQGWDDSDNGEDW